MEAPIMNRTLLAFVFAALALAATSLVAFEEKPKPRPKPKTKAELMKRKLELSQDLLASLTLNKLDAAGKQAAELVELPKHPEWKVKKTGLYNAFSDEFTRSLNGITKAAKDKNLESAKLNYLGLTMTCFNCHSYVRDPKSDL
jgi:hypothetical protein